MSLSPKGDEKRKSSIKAESCTTFIGAVAEIYVLCLPSPFYLFFYYNIQKKRGYISFPLHRVSAYAKDDTLWIICTKSCPYSRWWRWRLLPAHSWRCQGILNFHILVHDVKRFKLIFNTLLLFPSFFCQQTWRKFSIFITQIELVTWQNRIYL